MYPYLMRKAKQNLESLRDQEYKRAEEKLKSQFAMERMVYSEDGLYIEKFLAVKSEMESDRKHSDFDGTTQHLRAYLKVCHLLPLTQFLLYFPMHPYWSV